MLSYVMDDEDMFADSNVIDSQSWSCTGLMSLIRTRGMEDLDLMGAARSGLAV